MARNIMIVMDALEEVEPELRASLDAVRSSVRYSPPEMMGFHWKRIAAVLSSEAPPSHPNFGGLIAIFNGDKDGPCPA